MYPSYEAFLADLWFFEGESFDVSLVKSRYLEMNCVQKRVVDAFYSRLYSLDTGSFDFDRCQDLTEAVWNDISTDFLDEIVSDEILPVFGNLPEIIGISVTGTSQFLHACLLTRLIREICPDTVLIMGGSCADLFLKSNYKQKTDIRRFFDYVIVGEGETALSMLMAYLTRQEGETVRIPNLVSFDGCGNPTVAQQIVEDVSTLPVPSYDGLDLSLYLSAELILPYQSSRGCHYGYCAFCNHDEKYRHNYRTKDMKKTVQELLSLSRRYGVRCFQFVDEAIRPYCFREMVDEMDRCEEFQGIHWFFYSRVSRQYDKELLCKAARNGCRMVMFGVESFNQRLLGFIKKGINAETSRYCLRLFHECGIGTYAWLMCNIPSETLSEAREDLACVRNMDESIDAFSVGAFFLSKNTDMYADPEKYNITFVDEEDSYRFMSHHEGELIDKEAMLRFCEQEYKSYQRECFSTGNRYTLFWEKVAEKMR